MKVILLAHTPLPEKTVAAAAKLCYSQINVEDLYEGLTEEKAADFVEMLAELGHESPIEHASFTFGISGVSRAMMAQITRHRMASFSVQSQRYVKKDKLEYIVPPEIAADCKASEIYRNAMDADLKAYNELTDLLAAKHYPSFIESGMTEKQAKSAAEKKAIEDARFVLPNACDTQMIVTMNARSLYNFFRERCCNRAQWEIRAVAEKMLELCCEAAPTLFASAGPSCYKGGCPEGKMSCGKAAEMREKYAEIHESGRSK